VGRAFIVSNELALGFWQTEPGGQVRNCSQGWRNGRRAALGSGYTARDSCLWIKPRSSSSWVPPASSTDKTCHVSGKAEIVQCYREVPGDMLGDEWHYILIAETVLKVYNKKSFKISKALFLFQSHVNTQDFISI
jgi:hypothetical protein